jgi:perosamine synthetase
MRSDDDILAVRGGKPVRESMLPYGRQWIDDDDISAVSDVLRSDWLTTGPLVSGFEEKFAERVGTREAVSVSNGTAALHAAMFALGIKENDEVIVPPMTFAATANCVLYQGGKPVFSDVEPDTLLIAPQNVEALVTPRTKAIIAVDYAGHPCDYDALRIIADRHGLALVDDACHSLGGSYKQRPVGTLADMSIFSFHPVKHITSGEGGMIVTDDKKLAAKMRAFRGHGISTSLHQREQQGSWYYEMTDLGYNYRLTDIQCALGLSQLKKLSGWVERRQAIAEKYRIAFEAMTGITPLGTRNQVSHAYHLFVVRLDLDALSADRGMIFKALRAEGIGVNVHYIPVHLHPYYRTHLMTSPGQCPVAENAYHEILSLPIFPRMSDRDAEDVIRAVKKVTDAYL